MQVVEFIKSLLEHEDFVAAPKDLAVTVLNVFEEF